MMYSLMSREMKKRPRRRQNQSVFGGTSRAMRTALECLEQRILLAADLRISEMASPATTVAPGQMLDYTISITNSGNASASAANDTFTDTLPAGVTLVSASASQGSVTTMSNTTVSGSVGTLAAGATDTIHVRVTPDMGTTGALNNTVSVSGSDADTGAANNTATLALPAAAASATPADLSVTGSPTVDGSAAFFGTPVDSASGNSALVGQDITYNFTVTNNSTTNTAGNVQLTEMTPTGGTFLTTSTDTGTVSYSNGVVTANIGTLAPGASATVTIDLSSAAAGNMAASAFATTDSGDSDLSNNSADVSAVVNTASNTVPNGNTGTTAANLTITKTDSKGGAGAAPGQPVTYTITVTNNNSGSGANPTQGTASNVELFDTLPAGMNFISASAPSDSFDFVQFNNGTITDQLSDLFPGDSATLTIVASPSGSASGQLTNQAVATSDSGFVNSATQSASDTIAVNAAGSGAAALTVTKTDSASGTATPGQAVNYTITVTNTGATNSANNVVLTDNLPGGMTYVSASTSAGGGAGSPAGTATETNNTVTDNIGTLAPGQSAILTLMASPTNSGTVSNTAVVTTTSGVTAGSTPQATDTMTVGSPGTGAANLSITKFHSPLGTVTFGQDVTYTIQVTNNGTTAANNVVITDNFPSGMTFGSSSSKTGASGGTTTNNGTTSQSNGNVTDTIATLPAGQTATFTIIGSPNQGGTINNRATVTTTSGLTAPVSNVATDSFMVPTPDNVSVSGSSTVMGTATGSGNAALTGQDVTFTFIVTNNSTTASARNVVLSDMVPAGASYLSSSSSQGSVSQSAGTISANLGSLAAGASATVTIDLSGNSSGTLTNTATVTTPNGDNNPNTSATVSAPVNAPASGTAANLTITKTDSVGASGTVTPGRLVTYTITVVNNATDPLTGTASDVTLYDTLPSGMTFVSASPGQGTFGATGSVTYSNGTVTDDLSDVLPGETEVLTIVATPTASGTVTNHVVATSDSGFANSSSQTASDSFMVNSAASSAAGLTVTKTDSVGAFGTALPGQAVTYTITVTNSGATNTASNVALTDSLPSGLTYISASSAAGSASGSPSGTAAVTNNTVTDNIGTLAPGQSTTMTLVASPNNSGSVTNTAVATTSSGVDASSTNVASDTLNVAAAPNAAADLTISKFHSPLGTVTAGQNVTYTIAVANNGTTDASNVVITDNFPSGITYGSSSSTTGTSGATTNNGTTARSNGNVTDTIATLPAGQTATFTIVGMPSQAGTFNNRATVTSGSGMTTPVSNVATDSFTVPTPDNVSVSGAATVMGTATGSGNPAIAGQDVTFTFVVVNNSGSASAGNVVLSDMVPSGASYLSSSSSQGSVSRSAGTISANLGSLAAGASATVTIDLSANSPGTLTNTANVSTGNGDTSSNNSATVSVPVNAAASGTAANLTITKTDSVGASGTVTPGQLVTYTITVVNNATDPLTGTASEVTLYDTLPSGVTFVSASPGQGTFGATGSITYSNGTITDALSDVLPGETEVLTIVVTPTVPGTVTNQVVAASDSGFANSSRQTGSDTFTVSPAASNAAGLTVTKTDSVGAGGSALPGQAVTYTITVTNSGATNTASDVVLYDSLPTGLAFVSATSAAGSASGSPAGAATRANGLVTDNIGTLAPGQSTTMTLVAVPTSSGSITNTSVATTRSGVDASSSSVATDTLNVAAAGSTAADLSVTKLDSAVGAVVRPGQPVTYTITVTNNSATNAANNLVVTDNLPANETYGSSTSSLTASGGTAPTGAAAGTTANANGTVTDTIPTLAPGQVATFQIVVTPTQSGPITNTAVATTTSGTLNPQSLVASDSFNVAPALPNEANLSISKLATPNPATAGQPLTYTITVVNSGGASADNVVVTDVLPAGATFSTDSSSAGTVSQTNGTVTANLGSIAAGATDAVTIVVTPAQPGTLDNTASLATTSPNANTTTTASTSTVVSPATTSGASLSITIAAAPSPGTVGQQLTYTIMVNNSGSSAADNVVLTDTLPAGLTFANDSTTAGTASFSNGTVTDNLGTVAVGATETLTIVVTPTQAGTVQNTATVATTSNNSNPNTSATISTPINSTSPPPTGETCYLEGQPGDGSNAAFVHNLYRELLGREPDPSGQATFLNYLQSHNDSTGRLFAINVFLNSTEYRNHLVECVYENFLGRAADPGGLAFWTGALAGGFGERLLLEGIIGSPEYFQHNGGNAQGFVTALYHDLLGRAPDAPGEAGWVALVNNNTPLFLIVNGFLSSPEGENKLLNGNYGLSALPVSAAGAPANGTYALAQITGNGVDNLYLQGNAAAADQYFGQLHAGDSYESLIQDILGSRQYFGP